MTMLNKLEAIEVRYEEINRLLADPELATDYTRIQTLAKEQAGLRNLVQLSIEYKDVSRQLEDVRGLIRSESDQQITALAKEEQQDLDDRLAKLDDDLRQELIPKDPNDDKNVIMEIRAGTGGDEAGLFAADLYRMYTRYAQRNNWKIDVIDANQTGLGAIKEIVFLVKGENAYSRLKHESGGHRVQRIPVTESGGAHPHIGRDGCGPSRG